MLKRIKKIQNIGRFKSCSAGSVPFDKITLIFGRNTYGKSTLSDLFSSLSTGNTEAIKSRKTIPNNQQNQQIELAFEVEGQQNELIVKYSNNSWQSPLLTNDLKISVFDDGFYHNNLFAGRQFTRETKDSFSSFVLGLQGVSKRQEIEKKNKQKADATKIRNILDKTIFKDIENLSGFIQLSPSESIDNLQEKIDELRTKYSKLTEQQKNAVKIQERKECRILNWENDFSEALQKLNTVLQLSLQSHHIEARQKVADHIKLNFKETEKAENWIRQGLAKNNGKSCQFCGQSLNNKALELLDIYHQSFDAAYEEHDKNIKYQLKESFLLLTKERINSLKIIIESNNTLLLSYPELEDNKKYLSLKEKITLFINKLEEYFTQWAQHQVQFEEKINILINKKQESPHNTLETPQFDILLKLDEEIIKLTQEYNELVIQTNRIFQNFKTSVSDESLSQQLVETTIQGKMEKRKLQRLELTGQCEEYEKLEVIIFTLKKEIPILEGQLLDEQSNYLNQYFDRLNYYFRLFGSNDFQLEKSLDTRGHKPIYYLKVKFHGVDISEKNLDRVFSESDRRSLALAVFWASLSGLNDIEKKNTIVVLDDPVTSFDNHRISSVHREIISISENFRQIILLSHFEQGISTFLNTYQNNKPIRLLLIEKIENSSEIKEGSISDFIRNSHEKARDNIFNFVSGKTNIHNANALRVFLEIEINNRFAKQISNINEAKLSNRIDKLKDINAISAETACEVHKWRVQLNPEHHIWMGGDLEDQRRTAEQFMDFIYHKLIPSC